MYFLENGENSQRLEIFQRRGGKYSVALSPPVTLADCFVICSLVLLSCGWFRDEAERRKARELRRLISHRQHRPLRLLLLLLLMLMPKRTSVSQLNMKPCKLISVLRVRHCRSFVEYKLQFQQFPDGFL